VDCRENFKDLFDDEEEMNEAVFYLNLQGKMAITHTKLYSAHIELCRQMETDQVFFIQKCRCGEVCQ
jgi:hypothetical protein